MNLKVFSIYDVKGEIFMKPVVHKTVGEAERWFEAVAERDEMISKFAEDFDLYHLGEYDDNSGKLEPFDTVRHIAKASSFKNKISTKQ